MIRKRGAPVLIELIRHSPTGVPSSGDGVAPYPTRQTPRIPTSTGNIAENAAWSPASRRARQTLLLWALAIGGAIVLVVIGLWVGSLVGKKTTDQEWSKRMGEAGTTQVPTGQDGVAGGGVDTLAVPGPVPGVVHNGQGSDPLSEPALPAGGQDSSRGGVPGQGAGKPIVTEIQGGWNYLVVATLPWKDATEAGQYLAKHGYPALVQPKNKVDPSRAAANNTPCEVVLLSGYAPGAFREAQKEREALMTNIKGLGRRWRVENKRAPSDFSDAFWKKF